MGRFRAELLMNHKNGQFQGVASNEQQKWPVTGSSFHLTIKMASFRE